MKPRITVITLGVSDLARSIAFYERGLKLPRKALDNDSIAFFHLHAGQLLALFSLGELAHDARLPLRADDGGFRGITLAHNVDSQADVEAVLAEAQAAGARLLKPGQAPPWGGWSGYFADPDGHAWEVAWQPDLDF